MPSRRERVAQGQLTAHLQQLNLDAMAQAQQFEQILPSGVSRTQGGQLFGTASKTVKGALTQEHLAGSLYQSYMTAPGGGLSAGRTREYLNSSGLNRFLGQMQMAGRSDVVAASFAEAARAGAREQALLESIMFKMGSDPEGAQAWINRNKSLYRILTKGVTDPQQWENLQKSQFSEPFTLPGEKPWQGNTINEEFVWKPHLEAMRKSQQIAAKQGYELVASLSKPEDIVQGKYIDPKKLTALDVSVGGAFIRRDKAAAFHLITSATIPDEAAAAWAQYRFGSEIPRMPVSPLMADVRRGGFMMGRPMELMTRQVIVSPGQAWSSAVAGGALETEHIFINERLANIPYNPYGSSEPGLMGQGQAFTDALGNRRLAVGKLEAKWAEQTGIDVLTSSRLVSNPMTTMQGMAEHLVTLADVDANRGTMTALQQRLKAAGVAELELLVREEAGALAVWRTTGDDMGLYAAGKRRMEEHIASIGHGPRISAGTPAARYAAMSEQQKAFRGAFMLMRETARAIGIEQPFAHQAFETASGQTVRGRALVAGLRPRFEHLPTYKGVAINPSALLGLASLGEESGQVAEAFLEHAQRVGGKRSREFFAILNPALGHSTAYEGFKRVTTSQLDANLIQQIASTHSSWDLDTLAKVLANPDLPNQAMLLKLPEPIRMPTLGALAEIERVSATGKAASAIIAEQGAPTRVLAFPNLRGTLQGALDRAVAEGAEESFTAPLVGQTGRIIKAVAQWEAGSGSKSAVEYEVAKYVDLMAEHTSKKGLIHDLLNPRPGKTVPGAYYRGLSQGQLAANLPLNTVAPPTVGFGEVGLTPKALAEDLGYSSEQIKRIASGRPIGNEAYLYQQDFPQVSATTSGVSRIRVIPDEMMNRKQVVTHASHRFGSFRDVDVDPTQLSRLPENVSGEVAEQAFRQNAQLSQELWENLPADAREQWLSAKKAYARQGPLADRSFTKTLDSALAQGEHAGLTPEGAKKVVKSKAAPGLLYEETMRVREIMAQQQGLAKSYPGQAVLAPAYQMAGIKKGAAGDALGELHHVLSTKVPGRDLSKKEIQNLVPKILPVAQKIAEMGAPSDVHTAVSGARQRQGVEQLIQGYSKFNEERVTHQSGVGISRLAGGSKRLNSLEMFKALQDPRSGYRQDQWDKMVGLGGKNTPAMEALNRASKRGGAEGAAAGGVFGKAQRFWSKLPQGARTAAKWGAGGLGVLLGLRVAKSTFMGDEPSTPAAMRPMSPELQARMAMQQTDGLQGSALPPDPMVGPGIHQQTTPLPYVQMSPPPARVTDTRQINSKMRIHATDTTGMGSESLGSQMAGSMGTPLGVPSVDIFAPDDRIQSRLALNNEMQMRRESRFYAS